MQIFYAPNINGNIYTLPEEESKHCTRVLRLGQGDQICLIDGKGSLFTAQIVNPNPKRCEVMIINTQTEYGKRNFHIHIAIAPTKSIDRLEWFLEKCTEIGVDEITPLLCEHSERKVVNIERMEKIVISAIKQSQKAYMPQINKITPIKQFVHQPFNGQKFIAHCYSWDLPHLKDNITKGQDVAIMIGPEGDFSPIEVELAQKLGFMGISLGKARLRTETAGVVACHIANLFCEE